MRDGSGVVRDIQDGLGRLGKLESWKQWSGEEGESSDEGSLGEGEEVLQWTEVLRRASVGQMQGSFAPRSFKKWAIWIKDRTDVSLREMGVGKGSLVL